MRIKDTSRSVEPGHGLPGRPEGAPQLRRLEHLDVVRKVRPFRMWVCYLLRAAAGRKGLIEGVAGREMSLRRAARAS
jgi:hypothetical protein